MNFNWVSVVPFVLTVTTIFLNSSEAFRVRACGKELADLVQLVCSDRGGLYSPDNHIGKIRNRRSIHPVVGIVTECCLQTCTVRALHQYCQETESVLLTDDNKIDNSRQEQEEYVNYKKYMKYKKFNNEYRTDTNFVDSKKKEKNFRKSPIGYYIRDRPVFFARHS